MQSAMKSYPEFVGIDATFKLLSIRAPLYLVVVEDSEGCTEIVAACILMTEDRPSVTWFVDCFKNAHPSWDQIKCVMADKDFLEREVIKSSFPLAHVLICVFHSLRTFNREITCDKLGITAGQRDTAKEIFQKMVYAKTSSQYEQLYARLQDLPQSVKDYFNDNWHHIKDEWTVSEKFMQSNFLNTTNNRIESMNAKIKSVVLKYSSMEDFVENFFILVACLNTERDHKAAYAYQKRKVVLYDDDSPEKFYSQLLSGYGFKFIQPELKKRGNFVVEDETSSGAHVLRRQDGEHHTTIRSCDCGPHTSMKLPCRLVRGKKNQP